MREEDRVKPVFCGKEPASRSELQDSFIARLSAQPAHTPADLGRFENRRAG